MVPPCSSKRKAPAPEPTPANRQTPAQLLLEVTSEPLKELKRFLDEERRRVERLDSSLQAARESCAEKEGKLAASKQEVRAGEREIKRLRQEASSVFPAMERSQQQVVEAEERTRAALADLRALQLRLDNSKGWFEHQLREKDTLEARYRQEERALRAQVVRLEEQLQTLQG